MSELSRVIAGIKAELASQVLGIQERAKNINYLVNIQKQKTRQIESYISEGIHNDRLDILDTLIDELEKSEVFLFKEITFFHKLYKCFTTNIQKIDEIELALIRKSRDIQSGMLEYQGKKVKSYQEGPAIKRQNTKAFWDLYRQQYHQLTNDGMPPAKAKNIIGRRIEKNTGKKPHRTTLYRQLVSSGK